MNIPKYAEKLVCKIGECYHGKDDTEWCRLAFSHLDHYKKCPFNNPTPINKSECICED